MYCSRCGFQNEPGAAFCSKCGAPAESAATTAGQTPPVTFIPPQEPVPPQGYAPVPPQGYAPVPPQSYVPVPPKKKRTGLIIGLVAAAVVLIGAAAGAYFLFFNDAGLDGTWVCEDRGWVIEINDDMITEYSPAGTDTSRMVFTSSVGEAKLQDGDVSFTVKDDRLSLTDEVTGERYLFKRAKNNVEIEEVIISGFAGLWSSEALGEVLDLRENGKLAVYSGTGDYKASYTFDIDNGKGTIELAGDKYTFTVGWNALNIDDVGPYLRADKKLDIAVFVSQHANPLVATWYETTGVYGMITFYPEYTFDLVMYDQTSAGTYTYDAAKGTGTVTITQTGDVADFVYADGTLILDGLTFTQAFVQQPGAEEIFAAVEGVWYDMENADETVTFYNDGRMEVYTGGQYYTGTFTFDPFDLTGTITIEYLGEMTNTDFNLSEDKLVIDSYYYTREAVMPTGSILGTWYDIEGMQGTLYFDKDGLAIMDSYGTMFYGTYTFDQSSGSGSMTLDFVEGPFTWVLSLWEGKLNTGDATYTLDYVEQTTETNAG